MLTCGKILQDGYKNLNQDERDKKFKSSAVTAGAIK